MTFLVGNACGDGPRAAAVPVDEFDAGNLKKHCNSLRPHEKPVSYRFFLGALAV